MYTRGTRFVLHDIMQYCNNTSIIGIYNTNEKTYDIQILHYILFYVTERDWDNIIVIYIYIVLHTARRIARENEIKAIRKTAK